MRRTCRCPSGSIGRVCINGPSLMSGYYRNDVATHGVLLENGWLDTGDLGYLVDGQLVITGRSKDLIIVGGRNIWPQDLEWAVEHLEGVRAGRRRRVRGQPRRRQRACGGGGAVPRHRRPQPRSSCARPSRRPCGGPPASNARWCWRRPSSLTFTTSGKLSRAAVKADYLSGAIRDIAAAACRADPGELERLAVAS